MIDEFPNAVWLPTPIGESARMSPAAAVFMMWGAIQDSASPSVWDTLHWLSGKLNDYGTFIEDDVLVCETESPGVRRLGTRPCSWWLGPKGRPRLVFSPGLPNSDLGSCRGVRIEWGDEYAENDRMARSYQFNIQDLDANRIEVRNNGREATLIVYAKDPSIRTRITATFWSGNSGSPGSREARTSAFRIGFSSPEVADRAMKAVKHAVTRCQAAAKQEPF